MGTIRHEMFIDAPADRVWQVVGRADILHLWFPGITSCTVEGTTRTIVTGNGLPMPEEMVTRDDLLRRFQYRITAPLFRHHLGTIDVLSLDQLGAGRGSLVVYSTDAEPNAMALVVGGATLGALQELARQFAAGEGPALAARLQPAPTSAAGAADVGAGSGEETA